MVLKRAQHPPTPGELLWIAIRNRTNAISFNRYKRFIDEIRASALYHPSMSVESILAQLKQERDRIDAAIRALSSISTKKASVVGTKVGRKRRKGTMSPEARKRIADAQRRRWAEQRAKK